jgi:hypothetical protein
MMGDWLAPAYEEKRLRRTDCLAEIRKARPVARGLR